MNGGSAKWTVSIPSISSVLEGISDKGTLNDEEVDTWSPLSIDDLVRYLLRGFLVHRRLMAEFSS